MIDRDDLRYEIDRIAEQLDYNLQEQRRANARIRLEVATLSTFVALLAGVWAILHYDWPRWLIAILGLVLVPAVRAYLSHEITKEEDAKPR